MLDVHGRITQLPNVVKGEWQLHVPYKSDKNQEVLTVQYLLSKWIWNQNIWSIYIVLPTFYSHPPASPKEIVQASHSIKTSQTTKVGHRWSQELLRLLAWAGTHSASGNDSIHLFRLAYCIKNVWFFIESSSLKHKSINNQSTQLLVSDLFGDAMSPDIDDISPTCDVTCRRVSLQGGSVINPAL